MKRILQLVLAILLVLMGTSVGVACNSEPELPDYSNGYLIKISAVQRRPDDATDTFLPESFVVDGKTHFDAFAIEYGETLGDRLPSLDELIQDNLNDYQEMYWSAKVNGEVIKITSDTVFDVENIKAGKGNIIYIQITCIDFFSQRT
jgi:hypothetical protein